jgi:serine/threonine protein phosphatase PrpC
MTNEIPSPRRYLIRDSIGSRPEQEDAAVCLVSETGETAFLVVCDGVGGSSDGGGASRAVTEFAAAFWKEKGGKLTQPEEELPGFAREAHQKLRDSSAIRSSRTTLVALYLTSARAWWIHSGDSRLYHFRAGRLVTRTRDHSVVEVLVQQGAVEESEMGGHPDQGRLLQSLGGTDYDRPDLDSAELTPDDGFLLCTDGFWERTAAAEMAEILYGDRRRAGAALDQAVARAERRNGRKGDNLTVAVVLPLRTALPNQRSMLLIFFALLLIITAIFLLVYFAIEGPRHPH